MKNNNTWIKVAKNRERWTAMESEYEKTAAERTERTSPSLLFTANHRKIQSDQHAT